LSTFFLATVLLTATASADTVIPSPCPTLKVLEAAIVPPPVKPEPAVKVTDVWLMCSFATNPDKLS